MDAPPASLFLITSTVYFLAIFQERHKMFWLGSFFHSVTIHLLCAPIFFFPPNSFLTSKVLTMCSILFQQVIWGCLVEDSALFLRHVLERLTRDHQDEMFKLLRHLIRFIPRLPQQAAFALYNYIIGYVMFYVRSPHEDGQRLIGAALSILWMVRFM